MKIEVDQYCQDYIFDHTQTMGMKNNFGKRNMFME